jgi:acetyl esterase/lipase
MPFSKWALFLPVFLSMSKILGGSPVEVSPPKFIPDIEYARIAGTSLRMDAFIPESATKLAAVIIVHGGGWVAGDKRIDVQPLFKPLSEAGFAWFSINYRLATDATQFGVAIDDVQQAIRYVKSHAARFNIDPAKVGLIGESAGAQLAAVATLRGGPETAVKAVVALYPPTNLVELLNTSTYVPPQIRDSVRGTPWEQFVLAGLAQLSPVNNVHRGMPPFLFIHGTADSLVPFQQSREMCDRMKQVGASCEIYPVEGGGHGIRWWESYPKLAAGYKQKMVQWLKHELGAAEALTS